MCINKYIILICTHYKSISYRVKTVYICTKTSVFYVLLNIRCKETTFRNENYTRTTSSKRVMVEYIVLNTYAWGTSNVILFFLNTGAKNTKSYTEHDGEKTFPRRNYTDGHFLFIFLSIFVSRSETRRRRTVADIIVHGRDRRILKNRH